MLNPRSYCSALAVILFASSFARPLIAEQIFQLRNGLVLRGNKNEIPTIKEGFGAAAAAQAAVRPIWVIDDGLRRYFLHGRGMVAVPPVEAPNVGVSIEMWQQRLLGGDPVAGLGKILGVSPFNNDGRRLLTVRGPKGPISVIQGVKEMNPRYARLLALKSPKGQSNIRWDMRVATSSFTSDTLRTIFKDQRTSSDLGDRQDVLRFLIAAERIDLAKEVLLQTIRDFPEEENLRKQLVSLTTRQAEQLLQEARLRAASGQYQLSREILAGFPVQAVSRITRTEVQDELARLNQGDADRQSLIDQLKRQVGQLPLAQQKSLAGVLSEIENGLTADTMIRLSDYSRLRNASDLPIENRVALAIAGWLLGPGSGEQNLSIAAALVEVRDLVAEYLSTDNAARRTAILGVLQNTEGARPEYVDLVLPWLTPVKPLPEDAAIESSPGGFQIQTQRADYVVQLPPEYDRLRSYPCVVALHPAGGLPSDQIDWWAGVYDPDSEMRLGHATRNGYIVVAPRWSRPAQREYEYTPIEHERVLASVRDAMRRCSIDADRVFLAGHGEGGTAAWDISLAHPDIWAGMISVSGAPSKTVHHFESNSRYVPMYLVMGQLDGSVDAGVSAIMDDYMSFQHDALVVSYRGRGREFFYDEVPRLFEWMSTSAHERPAIPQKFETSTMREGDQFFWWLELGQLTSGVAINPILWDSQKRIRSATIEASIGSDNQIRVSNCPSDQFRLLLRPQPGIDINEEIVVRHGSRPLRFSFDGDLETMLEDVRRRADRRRAVWMEIEIP